MAGRDMVAAGLRAVAVGAGVLAVIVAATIAFPVAAASYAIALHDAFLELSWPVCALVQTAPFCADGVRAGVADGRDRTTVLVLVFLGHATWAVPATALLAVWAATHRCSVSVGAALVGYAVALWAMMRILA